MAMSAPPSTSFVARIQEMSDRLHPSEARLAEAILSFPGQIASYTATELAQMAQVSNATVTRFVRKIGYGSFEEARQAIRAEQVAGAALVRMGGAEGGLAQHIDQSHRNIDLTLSGLDSAMLDTISAAMGSAPRLWVIGFRAGQPLARYLGWQVLQVRSDVAILPRDGETLAESLAAVGSGDCVILFAMRRAPRLLSRVAKHLAKSGAQVAVIGDVAGLGALPGRWHLPCRTTAAGALFNHSAVMALCSYLASRAIEQAGPRGRQRLGEIEDLHRDLDEL